MPDIDAVRALLDRYCTAMSDHAREDWLDCFTDDATQEDPVGAPVNAGREALAKFFDDNDVRVVLTQTAEPLVVGNEVLAFMKVVAEMDGTTMTIPRIVDHIVVTDDGARIQSLRAFFDYSELVPLEE